MAPYTSTGTVFRIYAIPTAYNYGYGSRFVSKRERELQKLLREFETIVVETKLRRIEANRRAVLDVERRRQRKPVRGRPPEGMMLQTQRGAIFARMAPKKFGG